jgi:hypothetical protein
MSFYPQQNNIANITRSIICVVTTSKPHNLTTGQVVRIVVPKAYGMRELDNRLVSVTVLSLDSFSIQSSQVPPAVEINSTEFTAFVIPNLPQSFIAQIIPAGAGPTQILDPEVYLRNNTCISSVLDATTNRGK